MITLEQLSTRLRLGDRVTGTGNRAGRNERVALRDAVAERRIKPKVGKHWKWAEDDPVVLTGVGASGTDPGHGKP